MATIVAAHANADFTSGSDFKAVRSCWISCKTRQVTEKGTKARQSESEQEITTVSKLVFEAVRLAGVRQFGPWPIHLVPLLPLYSVTPADFG